MRSPSVTITPQLVCRGGTATRRPPKRLRRSRHVCRWPRRRCCRHTPPPEGPSKARAELASVRAPLSATLLFHRPLIPQPQPVAVRIAQLGAVAPKHLHRRMNKGYAGRGQQVVLRLDIVDLDRKRDTRAVHDIPLVKKNRQVGIVAHCRRFPVRDFELYFETQLILVPIAGFPPITDR